MCDIWKRRDREEFDPLRLERHRDSIKKLGVRHVVLTGGEPLLNRDLAAICTFFRGLNIKTTLLTTGLLLYKRAGLVAEMFDDLIISIDGPPAIHDQIRRIPSAFATIQRGVVAIRNHAPKLPISCRTTVQKLNHTHLRETVSAAKSLELNSISFLAADVSSKAFNREQGWTDERQREIALTRKEIDVLQNEINLLIATFEDEIRAGFIAENPMKLRRLVTRFLEYIEHIPPKAPLCNAPWVSAVIETDGSVKPCFFHETIGNINSSNLEDVVNSTTGMNFRENLDVATNAVCQRCVCSLNYRSNN